MSKKECDTCAEPTKHCQDKKYKHLMGASCWNHETYMPFPVWVAMQAGG